jgi:hypothetical protein
MDTTSSSLKVSRPKFSTTEILNKQGKTSKIRLLDMSMDTSTNRALKEAVTHYLQLEDKKKELEDSRIKQSSFIRSHIKEVRSYFNKKRIFTKTFRIEGNKTPLKRYFIDVTSLDKYSYSNKKEDLERLRNGIGKEIFNQIFEQKNIIKIRDVITDSETKRKEFTQDIITVLGIEKLREYFEEKVTYKLKPGLSERIYEYTPDIQATLLDYFTQALDNLSDASIVNDIKPD